jgi:site-specific recombinase XerD
MVADSWKITAPAFAAYLLSTGKSSETERTYVSRVSVFTSWALEHELCPAEADAPAIHSYIAHERVAGKAPNTMRNALYGLRAYYDYLVSRGQRADNPTAGLTVKKSKTLPKQPVCDEDVKRLTYGANCKRDVAIVAFFYSGGVRLAELAEVQIEHVLWASDTVLIHGKGDKWRPVKPGAEVMALLHEIAGERTAGPLWLTKDNAAMSKKRMRQNFGRLATRRGVRAHPHQLRATFANNALKSGMDLGALKEVMGHADISTTAHYAQATALERGLSQMDAMNLAGRVL